MNKAFTKSKVIKLDNNWVITSDGETSIKLVFSEMRQRKNKTTGEIENFLYEEPRWYTRISQSLKAYLDLSQNSSDSIEELITKTDYIVGVIDRIDRDFKQFE